MAEKLSTWITEKDLMEIKVTCNIFNKLSNVYHCLF